MKSNIWRNITQHKNRPKTGFKPINLHEPKQTFATLCESSKAVCLNMQHFVALIAGKNGLLVTGKVKKMLVSNWKSKKMAC